jgi:peptidoglycan/LPS O-acetylase OafA/YrhL
LNAIDSEHSSGFSYKPALDGLRAVAVCGVIAFHFGANGFEGGFLGVDTFFVLSGYLITSLLLSEWGRTKGLDFLAFWTRRAKRLLPALFLVLIAVAIWARLESSSARFGTIRGDLLSTLFYGANWRFIASGQSYFDLVVGDPSPLRHAWSLAIEEQFYLVWPLITFAALKLGRGKPRVLAGVCVVGIAASVAVMALVYDSADPSRAYFGTDARAAQLLVGALLAIVLTRWSPTTTVQRRAVQVFGLAGAGFTLWAFMSIADTDSWMYHGGFLLFAVATAFLIVAIVQPAGSPVGRVLAFGPFRWIGMISYGLYLWHWPVQIFLSESRTGLSDWGLALVRLAATFGIATASYYLVERPIRRGALKGWVARAAAPAAFVAIAILSIALTAGIEAQPDFLAAAPETVLKSGPPPSVASTAPAQVNVGRVLLLGDSVASSLSDGLQAEAARRGIPLSSTTRPGCGLVTGIPASGDGSELPWGRGCANSTLGYLDTAVRDDQPTTVLWLSTWETLGRIIDGKLVEFGTPAFDAALLAEFEESRVHLTSGGAHLVLITNAPRAEHSDTVFNIPDETSRTQHLNRLYKTFAAQHPESVTVVDLAAIVCPTGPPCPEFVDGVRLRPRDGGHYEGDGPAWVAPRLLDAISAAVAKLP